MIQQNDFECVGQVAIHCDNKKLCIAINEAEIFDLANLFCDVWPEIVEINTEVTNYQTALAEYEKCVNTGGEDCIIPVEPENYAEKNNLINGGSYIGCNGKTKKHYGIKRIWVYYAYARYVLVNNFNDTPNGNVSKTNDFSIPKPLKEIQSFADKYRTMGYDAFKMTLDFICHHQHLFEDVKCLPCNSCGCGCEACGGTKAKGYGSKFRNIEKI